MTDIDVGLQLQAAKKQASVVVEAVDRLMKLADSPVKRQPSGAEDGSPEITLTINQMLSIVLNAEVAVEAEFVGRITALHNWANARADSLRAGSSSNGEYLSLTHPELHSLIKDLVNLL